MPKPAFEANLKLARSRLRAEFRFYARWVALGLFPILLVATFKVHGANGWLFTNEGGGWEFPAFFAIACLVQFLLGEGAYSLREYLHHRRQDRPS